MCRVQFVHNNNIIAVDDDRHVPDVSTNTIADRPGIGSFCAVVEMPQDASLVLLSKVQCAAVHKGSSCLNGVVLLGCTHMVLTVCYRLI